MKSWFVIFVSVVLSFNLVYAAANATIEWNGTDYDFGKILKNKPVSAEFTFRNPGMIPLVISSVKPSCGCTVADYPKQPIPPGGTGTIKVTYDAKVSGYFSKTISVYTNTEEGMTNLFIKGEVILK